MPIEEDNFSDDGEIEFEVAGRGERGTEFDQEGLEDIGEEVGDEWSDREHREGVWLGSDRSTFCESRENGAEYQDEGDDDDDDDDDGDEDNDENEMRKLQIRIAAKYYLRSMFQN